MDTRDQNDLIFMEIKMINKTMTDLVCHNCKNKWEAEMIIEYACNYREIPEPDCFCPECGHENEDAEECCTCEEMKENI